MTTQLAQLLDAALAGEARAEQERQAAIGAGCEAARAAVTAAFGDLWDELAPHADDGHYWTSNGQVTTWWTVVDVPGLAPFSAAFTFHRHSAGQPFLAAASEPSSSHTHTPFHELPEFLLGRRRAWQEAEARRIEKEIGAILYKLNGWRSQRAASIAEAEAARDWLIELAPDRSAEWADLYTAWWDGYQEDLREHAAEAAYKARQAELADEYLVAYTAYWAEYQATLTLNRARLDAYQAELDRPLAAWRLTYARVAEIAGDENEQSERFLETEQVYILADGPDAEGYYAVAGAGTPLRRLNYKHVVSVEGPFTFLPTADEVYGRVRLDAPDKWDWYTLRFDPRDDAEAIGCQAAGLLAPWPVKPAAPDGLDEHTAQRIRHQVTHSAGDQAGDDECPF